MGIAGALDQATAVAFNKGMRFSFPGSSVWRWAVIPLLVTLAACTSWRPRTVHDGWTLYGKKGQEIDSAAFQDAFDPALAVVEETLGPFHAQVRVFAWDEGAEREGPGSERIEEGDEGRVQHVPGIGPARVRAFHARGDGLFGPPAGVFVGTPEPGTAAHELVHARLAEEHVSYPLWLEEGLACVIGDGFLAEDRWVIDGLACWPLQQLHDQELDDEELAQLLRLHAEDLASVRDNVLVHFVGWAIVFDLYRETGRIDWEAWRARFASGVDVSEARRRLDRTLSRETLLAWLERLSDPRREVRMATAKGLWKLRTPDIMRALLARLEVEDDAEVKVCLAINALAAAGASGPFDTMTGRMWRSVWPVLKRATLADATEHDALRALFRSMRVRTRQTPQDQLQMLKRFWAE